MTNPTPLSQAAKAVLDAVRIHWETSPVKEQQWCIACVLRAAADQASYCLDGSAYCVIAKDDLLAIAAELEGASD